MYYDLIKTKVGNILLVGDSECLKVVNIQNSKREYAIPSDWKQNKVFFKEIEEQLFQYL